MSNNYPLIIDKDTVDFMIGEIIFGREYHQNSFRFEDIYSIKTDNINSVPFHPSQLPDYESLPLVNRVFSLFLINNKEETIRFGLVYNIDINTGRLSIAFNDILLYIDREPKLMGWNNLYKLFYIQATNSFVIKCKYDLP